MIFDSSSVLICTNLFKKLVESRDWTIVVPTPVLDELNALTQVSIVSDKVSGVLRTIREFLSAKLLKVVNNGGQIVSSWDKWQATAQLSVLDDAARGQIICQADRDSYVSALYRICHHLASPSGSKSLGKKPVSTSGQVEDHSQVIKMVLISCDPALRLIGRELGIASLSSTTLRSLPHSKLEKGMPLTPKGVTSSPNSPNVNMSQEQKVKKK